MRGLCWNAGARWRGGCGGGVRGGTARGNAKCGMRNWGTAGTAGRGGNAELECEGTTRLAIALAVGARPALRFCRGLRYVPFLFRRVEIAIRAFSRCWCGYLPLWVHFGFGRFLPAISTGYRGTGYGADGVAVVLFCVIILALKCFPLGVRWDCAKESKVEAALRPLWTLFRGWPSERVRFTRRSALARVRRCVSVAAFCHRFTPAVCRMATNRTACDSLRSYSAGSRSLFVRSCGAGAVI